MNENALYIKLEQIPGGVRMTENYSNRFVGCIQQDFMHESMMVLQGLVSVIDEIDRKIIWNNLYHLFGCNKNTLKRYLWMLAENSEGARLFDRGHGDCREIFMMEEVLPVQTSLSFSVSTEPADSRMLSVEIRDNIFRYADSGNNCGINPTAITAAAFAEVLYRELYFPALKLLAGDRSTELIKSFIDRSLDERFVHTA